MEVNKTVCLFIILTVFVVNDKHVVILLMEMEIR